MLHSLSRFCSCTKKELLSTLISRNTEHGFENNRWTTFGYKKYKKKINKKTRELREPTPELKTIQDNIRKLLINIPVSLCSTAGKEGDSAEKNAELHRYNRYLITLDIKNAYPSIDTRRVYENLKGALLGKNLNTRAPLLKTPDKQELFIRALTHLCVSENELPQ